MDLLKKGTTKFAQCQEEERAAKKMKLEAAKNKEVYLTCRQLVE